MSSLPGSLFRPGRWPPQSPETEHFDHRPLGAAESNPEDTDRVIPKVEPLGVALDTQVCAIPDSGVVGTPDEGQDLDCTDLV